MKIFNRGNETKPPAPAGPAAAAAVTSVPPPAAPAPQAQAPPAAPDITAILDSNVKEMSEKITRLASTIEAGQQERAGFEAKIEAMEDRMRKLSSLTEMISAQYNPFVGDAPAEREPLPAPDVGLAQSAAAAPALPAIMQPLPAAEPEQAPLVVLAAPPAPAQAPEPPAQAAAPPAEAEPAPNGVHLWAAGSSFESSMLMLSWADMLLKAAGSRDAVAALAAYYHNIGWIGDPARDQLLAYADGLAAPEGDPAADWRAGSDVHERTLLFVEKLKAAARRAA